MADTMNTSEARAYVRKYARDLNPAQVITVAKDMAHWTKTITLGKKAATAARARLGI
jgi:hypothetical protein